MGLEIMSTVSCWILVGRDPTLVQGSASLNQTQLCSCGQSWWVAPKWQWSFGAGKNPVSMTTSRPKEHDTHKLFRFEQYLCSFHSSASSYLLHLVHWSWCKRPFLILTRLNVGLQPQISWTASATLSSPVLWRGASLRLSIQMLCGYWLVMTQVKSRCPLPYALRISPNNSCGCCLFYTLYLVAGDDFFICCHNVSFPELLYHQYEDEQWTQASNFHDACQECFNMDQQTAVDVIQLKWTSNCWQVLYFRVCRIRGWSIWIGNCYGRTVLVQPFSPTIFWVLFCYLVYFWPSNKVFLF